MDRTNIYIGNNASFCQTLMIDGQEMVSTDREKYLGAKINENVLMSRDTGISNQMIVLKELYFGIYHFEMGLLFRTSQLLNGILFNTEAMSSLTSKHLDMLEECDKQLMRNIFNAEIGKPIESFFIETSTLPSKPGKGGVIGQDDQATNLQTSCRKSAEISPTILMRSEEYTPNL